MYIIRLDTLPLNKLYTPLTALNRYNKPFLQIWGYVEKCSV